MPAKEIRFDHNARERLLQGVETLAASITTLGSACSRASRRWPTPCA
jgi:hypothetical protein